MSSLWTPGGERPVPPPSAPPPPGPPPGSPPDDAGDAADEAAQLAAIQKRLAETPAADVVINHCVGLWELAALHLSLQPPQLDQASVAIDALGAIVERLEGRLGENEAPMRESLAQIRMAFVQIKAAPSEPG